MSAGKEKSLLNERSDASPENLRSLRKDPKPSQKRVENEVASVYQDLVKVYRTLRKFWVHLDDLHEEGDFETLKSQQIEFRVYTQNFSQLMTKFKELRSLDSWNIFSFPAYSEFLLNEAPTEHANMKSLMLREDSPSPIDLVQERMSKLNVSHTPTSATQSRNARLIANFASPEALRRSNLDDSLHDHIAGTNIYHTHNKGLQPSSNLVEDIEGARVNPDFATNNQAVSIQNSFLKEIFLRQHLPKVVPDVFTGEPTRFHAWKSSFEAMIQGTNLSPQQEMVYLLQYTSGKVKTLVEAFRNRRLEPSLCLSQLWIELRRRFGSPATVANSYLERLTKAAGFRENDRLGLQSFADLCEDVESQMEVLPTLSCLNFPLLSFM